MNHERDIHMKIIEVKTELLRMPLPRPMMSGSSSGAKGGPVGHINMPLVFITTESGLTGLGYAWSLLGGAKATRSVLADDFAPLLLGEDALDHERLWHKLYKRLQSVGRHGLVAQAQAAIDLALWDIKGRAAGLPVYKLLGGRRESAPVYGSDGGWLYMSVDEMLAAFESYLEQGMMGVKMKIGHEDPRDDIRRIAAIRKSLGDDVWIAADANQKWDFPTALWVGRELERLGVAWFEEPLLCEDIPGHARLAAALDIPVAMGETLGSRFEFAAYLRAEAVDILQPDIIRVGGLSETVKVVTLADAAPTARGPPPHDGMFHSGGLRRHGIGTHRIHALGGRRLCRTRPHRKGHDVSPAKTGSRAGDPRGSFGEIPRGIDGYGFEVKGAPARRNLPSSPAAPRFGIYKPPHERLKLFGRRVVPSGQGRRPGIVSPVIAGGQVEIPGGVAIQAPEAAGIVGPDIPAGRAATSFPLIRILPGRNVPP